MKKVTYICDRCGKEYDPETQEHKTEEGKNVLFEYFRIRFEWVGKENNGLRLVNEKNFDLCPRCANIMYNTMMIPQIKK